MRASIYWALTKYLVLFLIFTHINSIDVVKYIPHLIDEENEAQRGQVDLMWTQVLVQLGEALEIKTCT